jgi:hypothetical protein
MPKARIRRKPPIRKRENGSMSLLFAKPRLNKPAQQDRMKEEGIVAEFARKAYGC